MIYKQLTSRWRRALAVTAGFLACAPSAYSDISATPPFVSRPDLNPPSFNITIYNPLQISPGYWFVAPRTADGKGTQAGPYIYDNSGALVWSGYSDASASWTWNFHPITYNGTTAFSYWQGNLIGIHGRGHGVILDSIYQPLDTVYAGDDRLALDSHEFKVLDGSPATAMFTVYEPVRMDLSAYGVQGVVGWVLESIFREVEIETGKLVFEWRSLEHVPLEESLVTFKGTGTDEGSGFDYFHINSIDKMPTGDYLISARHTSAVYLISKSTGEVIWRLSSQPNSNFALANFSFSSQHDARYRPSFSTPTSTVISLFDNGSDGYNKTGNSMGMLISLPYPPSSNGTSTADTISKPTATLLVLYSHPQHIQSTSQGNVQLPLPNGNVVVSWGDARSITEHIKAGDCVLEAHFDDPTITTYRSFKVELPQIIPAAPPDLYVYSHNHSAQTPTIFYASWNGATAVNAWRFYGSTTNNTDDYFTLAGYVPKAGFETQFVFSGLTEPFSWGIAEAVDQDGNGIRNSTAVRTFVPSEKLSASCNDIACPLASTSSATASRNGPFVPPIPTAASQGPRPSTLSPHYTSGVCWQCSDGIALVVMFGFTGAVLGAVLILAPLRTWWLAKRDWEIKRREGKSRRSKSVLESRIGGRKRGWWWRIWGPIAAWVGCICMFLVVWIVG